jgi:hypothetical protein
MEAQVQPHTSPHGVGHKLALGYVFVSEIWLSPAVAYPRILFRGGATNSVEGRGQRERGSGGGGRP